MDWNEEKQDESSLLPRANDIKTQETTETLTIAHFKRPLSDTNTPKSPTSPLISGSQTPFSQPDKKKKSDQDPTHLPRLRITKWTPR